MQHEDAVTVWRWRERATSVPLPSPSRRGPWLQWVVMVAAGAVLFFYFGHRLAGGVVWGLSLLLLAGLLFCQGILRGFERVGEGLGRGIGTAMTWGLLVPFFYVVFGAGSLFLKLRGVDPLRRARDPGAASYWMAHRKLTIRDRYQKQF